MTVKSSRHGKARQDLDTLRDRKYQLIKHLDNITGRGNAHTWQGAFHSYTKSALTTKDKEKTKLSWLCSTSDAIGDRFPRQYPMHSQIYNFPWIFPQSTAKLT